MTDLMVTPESIDSYLAENPPPCANTSNESIVSGTPLGKQPHARPEIIENAGLPAYTGGYAASDSTSPDKRGVATAPISVRESEAASVVPGGSGCASVAEAPPAAKRRLIEHLAYCPHSTPEDERAALALQASAPVSEFNPGAYSNNEVAALFWTLKNEMKERGLSTTTHPWPPPKKADRG